MIGRSQCTLNLPQIPFLQRFGDLNHNACDRTPKRTGGFMKSFALTLIVLIAGSLAGPLFAQDRVRIGVPLFPTVSYPVFIAHERGFFDKNGLKGEIIRINSEPTTYQALISGDIDATSGAPTGSVQSNIPGVPDMTCGKWDKC